MEVGDRILMIKKYNDIAREGLRGTIINIVNSNTNIAEVAIEFDDYVGGHNCRGTCIDGHGQFVTPDCVKVIEPSYDKNKKINYIVHYAFLSGDKLKCRYFNDFGKMQEFIEKILLGKNVSKSSIRVFEIKKVYNPKMEIKIELQEDKKWNK